MLALELSKREAEETEARKKKEIEKSDIKVLNKKTDKNSEIDSQLKNPQIVSNSENDGVSKADESSVPIENTVDQLKNVDYKPLEEIKKSIDELDEQNLEKPEAESSAAEKDKTISVESKIPAKNVKPRNKNIDSKSKEESSFEDVNIFLLL